MGEKAKGKNNRTAKKMAVAKARKAGLRPHEQRQQAAAATQPRF